MTAYHVALTIDFGQVGFWDRNHSFRVQLDIAPLTELIRATNNAHRVYELLLIDRPGDIWDYVWVVLDEVPQRVADRVEYARNKVHPTRVKLPHPWPQDRIPFKVFDNLFFWADDDTEPEDEAWLNHRNCALMHSFAQQALSIARTAQSSLDWSDHLLRHITSRVRSGEHPYCYLDRDAARTKSRELLSKDAGHTPAFYEKLRKLLRDANLTSIAYRASGDSHVLRMMATEQRRRANLTGHEAGNAMHLSALVNYKISNDAWESEIWFFDEGLAHGDLFIEGGGLGGGNLKQLFESHHRAPCNFILSVRDEGSIAGFNMESGDGWVLYSQQNPEPRRMALQRIGHLRRSKLAAVLSFAPSGATLFGHDKLVVFVGEEVSANARSTLAESIAEWQRLGGDPLLIVIGDTVPFNLTGCKNAVSVPTYMSDENSLARWLFAQLKRLCPWIDVIVALRTPHWAKQVLTAQLQHQHGPWPAWVVATENNCSNLKVDHLLEGDLEPVLMEAHRRAKNTRPQIL